MRASCKSRGGGLAPAGSRYGVTTCSTRRPVATARLATPGRRRGRRRLHVVVHVAGHGDYARSRWDRGQLIVEPTSPGRADGIAGAGARIAAEPRRHEEQERLP